jgi:type III pantothenate kinase
MLLAVDIGNTNIVLGWFDGDRLLFKSRLASDPVRTPDEYGLQIRSFITQAGLDPLRVTDCAVSSVVPPLDATFDTVARSLGTGGIEPFFVNCRVKLNIGIGIENPDELGADRIVNAAAAYERFRSALIVLDFGTATTVEYLSADGIYRGGVILPGIRLMSESLHRRTAKLPDVRMSRPEALLGRNTAESIRSGVYHLNVGGLGHIIRSIRATDPSARVVATGGLAGFIAPDLPEIDAIESDLTLLGLKFLYGLNRR